MCLGVENELSSSSDDEEEESRRAEVPKPLVMTTGGKNTVSLEEVALLREGKVTAPTAPRPLVSYVIFVCACVRWRTHIHTARVFVCVHIQMCLATLALMRKTRRLQMGQRAPCPPLSLPSSLVRSRTRNPNPLYGPSPPVLKQILHMRRLGRAQS